jgi:predicted dehydrogenase
MADGDRLRLGLIGAGSVTGQHLPVLKALGRTELVGVVSRTPDRATATAVEWGGRAFTDTEQMLDEQKPDVAMVCLPPYLTSAACELLAHRGIPFLTEKPLAADPESPARVARLVEERNLVTAVGYQWRALDFLPEVRARIAERPPRLLVAHWLGGTPPPAWWHRVDQGGGQVVEQATHQYDFARALLGEATVLAAAAGHYPRPNEADVDVAAVASALLRFESGAIGSFSNTRLLASDLIQVVLVSDGLQITIGLRGWPAQVWTATFEDDAGVRRVTSGANPFVAQDAAFLDAVAANDPTLVFCTYADALRTDRLTRAVVAATGVGG